MTVQTLLVMLLLMVIGGGTQSTAGGIKINVFAVVMLNLKSVLRGSDRVRILHRELSADSTPLYADALCRRVFSFAVRT